MSTAAVTESAEPILRLRGVGRRFGGLAAVRDVDLDVAHGERRAVLGPNGAGKTTLFNVISGDVAPTSGTMSFAGRRWGRCPPRPGAARHGAHLPEVPLLPRPDGQDKLYFAVLGVGPGHFRPIVTRLGRSDARACGRSRRRHRAAGAERASSLAVARRAAAARDRHGASVGPDSDDARRAASAVAASVPRSPAAALARPEDHPDPDRARMDVALAWRSA